MIIPFKAFVIGMGTNSFYRYGNIGKPNYGISILTTDNKASNNSVAGFRSDTPLGSFGWLHLSTISGSMSSFIFKTGL